MPAPTISALPTAPVRGSGGAAFTATADTWAAALPGFTTQINALATYLDALALGNTATGSFTNISVSGSISITGVSGVYGWGNTGTNTDIANMDATNKAAGLYRVTGTTTGTKPGAFTGTGQVLHCVQSSTSLLQILWATGSDQLYYRRYDSGSWQSWRSVLDDANFRTLVPLSFQTSQATTSGSTIDFTGLPSWVNRITPVFSGVSLSGTDDILIQLGTSGGFVSTGYSSASGTIDPGGSVAAHNSAAGFCIFSASAADTFTGHMTITRAASGGSEWVASHSGQRGTKVVNGGGRIASLGGTLDRVRLTVSGSNTFDAGAINLILE